MAAPTIPPYAGTVPQRSQAPSDFANNADDWVAYQSPLAAAYNALGDYVDDEAATIQGLADDAATSETNAATSASNASTSETNASTSETNAATSASNASTSETNAGVSATSAANSFDSFDDRYLGAKTSDPTVDNDGDALLTGALYFNSNTDNMRVYLGSAWANITNVTGSVDINGGTIDGTPIGETTKSTGKFTNLEADNISAYGASLIDDADAAAARSTLGLGTAAQSDITTSAFDLTAGRTSKTGDFGIGDGVENNNAFARDVLTINYTGFSRVLAESDKLPINDNGYIISQFRSVESFTLTFISDSGKSFINSVNGGTASGWVETASSLNNSLITFGSNSNGRFTRFPDGTLLMQTVLFDVSIISPYVPPSSYVGGFDGLSIVASAGGSDNTGAVTYKVVGSGNGVAGGQTNSNQSFRLQDPNGTYPINSSFRPKIVIIAVGRWK